MSTTVATTTTTTITDYSAVLPPPLPPGHNDLSSATTTTTAITANTDGGCCLKGVYGFQCTDPADEATCLAADGDNVFLGAGVECTTTSCNDAGGDDVDNTDSAAGGCCLKSAGGWQCIDIFHEERCLGTDAYTVFLGAGVECTATSCDDAGGDYVVDTDSAVGGCCLKSADGYRQCTDIVNEVRCLGADAVFLAGVECAATSCTDAGVDYVDNADVGGCCLKRADGWQCTGYLHEARCLGADAWRNVFLGAGVACTDENCADEPNTGLTDGEGVSAENPTDAMESSGDKLDDDNTNAGVRADTPVSGLVLLVTALLARYSIQLG